MTYPLHGEEVVADQDGEQQSVDEEELKHMAGILVKDMPQSSCYYRFSNKQHQRVKYLTSRPENGVERGSDFQEKFKNKRGAGRGCIEVIGTFFSVEKVCCCHVCREYLIKSFV